MSVWVVPGARRNDVVGLHGHDLKVRVAAPPERGRANETVAQMLGSATGATQVTLVSGATSRRKQYLLHDVDGPRAAAALGLDLRDDRAGG